MGVIMGAVGKSPAIEKSNRLLQESCQLTVGRYLEQQVIGTCRETKERYPKTFIDWSFVGKDKKRDEPV